MKLKTVLVFNTIVAVIFGLAFIFIPTRTISFYGTDAMNSQFKYTAQLFGSALFAFGLISWAARNSTESNARSAIVVGMFVGDLIGFVIALINQLSGVVNALGWLNVAIYGLLSAGFGYFI